MPAACTARAKASLRMPSCNQHEPRPRLHGQDVVEVLRQRLRATEDIDDVDRLAQRGQRVARTGSPQSVLPASIAFTGRIR